MKHGTLYGIGTGPGDAELLTLKAVRLLASCPYVYLPDSGMNRPSPVAQVVERFCRPDAVLREMAFSRDPDPVARKRYWQGPASAIAAELRAGHDVAFVSLGDPLVYSTYIYLLQDLKEQMPEATIETVPGISSFSHAAALTGFPLGEGSEPLTVLPASSDLQQVASTLARGGSLVLMKLGCCLPQILRLLEQAGLLEQAVFVARAGLPEQQVETDLRRLIGAPPETGHLAVILVHGERK